MKTKRLPIFMAAFFSSIAMGYSPQEFNADNERALAAINPYFTEAANSCRAQIAANIKQEVKTAFGLVSPIKTTYSPAEDSSRPLELIYKDRNERKVVLRKPAEIRISVIPVFYDRNGRELRQTTDSNGNLQFSFRSSSQSKDMQHYKTLDDLNKAQSFGPVAWFKPGATVYKTLDHFDVIDNESDSDSEVPAITVPAKTYGTCVADAIGKKLVEKTKKDSRPAVVIPGRAL